MPPPPGAVLTFGGMEIDRANPASGRAVVSQGRLGQATGTDVQEGRNVKGLAQAHRVYPLDMPTLQCCVPSGVAQCYVP